MLKLLIAIALTLTMVSAKNHKGHKNHKNHKSHKHGGKHINNGSNSVIKPNKIKNGDNILDGTKNRLESDIEREIGKQVIKSVL